MLVSQLAQLVVSQKWDFRNRSRAWSSVHKCLVLQLLERNICSPPSSHQSDMLKWVKMSLEERNMHTTNTWIGQQCSYQGNLGGQKQGTMSETGNNYVGLCWAFLCNNYLKLSAGFPWSLSLPLPNDKRIHVTNFAVGYAMEMHNATSLSGSLVKSWLMLILQGLFKGWKHSGEVKECDHFMNSSCICAFSQTEDTMAPLGHASKVRCHCRNGLYGSTKTIKK